MIKAIKITYQEPDFLTGYPDQDVNIFYIEIETSHYTIDWELEDIEGLCLVETVVNGIKDECPEIETIDLYSIFKEARKKGYCEKVFS